MVSITGNLFLTVAFLLVGPVPLLSTMNPTKILIHCSAAILGSGYAMVNVSTFGRSQSAAIRNGYNADIDTYMFISSKLNHSLISIIMKSSIFNKIKLLVFKMINKL
jgi:hypothetical protein